MDREEILGLCKVRERDVIHGVLDRLGKWSLEDFVKFSKAKCKVLQQGWGNPRHKYRLGDEQLKSSRAEKDLEVLVGKKPNMHWRPRKPPVSWVPSATAGPGRGFCPYCLFW